MKDDLKQVLINGQYVHVEIVRDDDLNTHISFPLNGKVVDIKFPHSQTRLLYKILDNHLSLEDEDSH